MLEQPADWLIDMLEAYAGRCIDASGQLATTSASVYGIVVDRGISIWPRFALCTHGTCLASVVANVTPAPAIDEPVTPEPVDPAPAADEPPAATEAPATEPAPAADEPPAATEAPATEPAPAAVVVEEPAITVAVGDFLVLHTDGHLRVATHDESLTMDVIARCRENYSGPPKLVLVSAWL